MAQKGQKFQVSKRKVVFSKGPIHLVDCDVRMPDGRVFSRQILEHRGAVVIIPRLAGDRFLLIRQFRFAARTWMWEWPAGGIDRGESPRQAAVRELMEEAGYRPGRLRSLIKFYPTPGVSAEMMHLYLAENLRPEKAAGDEDEEIEIGEFSLKQIGGMIRQGKIQDAKTLIGYSCLRYPGMLEKS